MIIQLAGLPGTGKTTLARGLARGLGAVVLSKDDVRHAVFTTAVNYDRDQDDLCVSFLFQAATYLLERQPGTTVILDGRTCLRAYQVEQVRNLARQLGQPLNIIECVCAEAIVKRRLAADPGHVAANRNALLYDAIRAGAESIGDPKIMLETGAEPDAVLAECLRLLRDHQIPRLPEARDVH
jgi:predicted kinase